MTQQRKIIHIDMDAFFASVEQRDNPALRGKPVVVGGNPQSRGVVAAASYEARKFGIHSAMPTSQAYRKCPDAVFVMPRFDAYRQASKAIQAVFHQYTDLVEPLSLDEAYLDVSGSTLLQGSATLIAQQIKQDIQNSIGLTASAGISHNKFLAKLASDMDKPDGIFVIKPGEEHAILEALEIRKFHGIGKATEAKMQALGIFTGLDLKQSEKQLLQTNFGKSGSYFYRIARGIDNRPVNNHRERKSVGVERTFQEDLLDKAQVVKKLQTLVEMAFERLASTGMQARTLSLKVRYDNFELITRSVSHDQIFSTCDEVKQQLPHLIDKTDIGLRPLRLLGINFANLIDPSHSPSNGSEPLSTKPLAKSAGKESSIPQQLSLL